MLVSLENYDNTLTSARIDSVIAGWTKAGLFAHLSNAEISKAVDDAEADDLFSVDGLLKNFPGVIYPFMSSFDSPKHIYSTLLSHFAEITHGAFNPTKITQRKENGGIRLQYLSNGKIHSYTFKTTTGFLDDGFSTFMKSLASENNLPGSFYTLKYAADIIYLTKQQHDYIVNHNLLDLGEE